MMIMPKGMDMASVDTSNDSWRESGMPVRNMWCIHTPKLRGSTTRAVEMMIQFLPARGLPVKDGSRLAMTPNAGSRTM